MKGAIQRPRPDLGSLKREILQRDFKLEFIKGKKKGMVEEIHRQEGGGWVGGGGGG